MKDVRVKVWGILFAILMCATFIPVMNRVTVLLTYGWSRGTGSSRLAQQARYIESRGQFLDPRCIDLVGVDLPAIAVVDEHP